MSESSKRSSVDEKGGRAGEKDERKEMRQARGHDRGCIVARESNAGPTSLKSELVGHSSPRVLGVALRAVSARPRRSVEQRTGFSGLCTRWGSEESTERERERERERQGERQRGCERKYDTSCRIQQDGTTTTKPRAQRWCLTGLGPGVIISDCQKLIACCLFPTRHNTQLLINT
jgi:hypothetical protein